MIRTLLVAALTIVLSACGDSSPGLLAGTWKVSGGVPITITFRSGETETMGMIEKVGYATDGQSVVVTYKDGIMKGTAIRFSLLSPTTAQAMNMTYRKVGG